MLDCSLSILRSSVLHFISHRLHSDLLSGTMPKTKKQTQRPKESAKKMKTETDAVEKDSQPMDESEGELHSDFEVHQVFQRLPAHVLQDIHGYLDFIEATKKCRVSKLWKLVENPVLRKGIVLLELPTDATYQRRREMDDKLKSITRSSDSWTSSMPKMKTARIQHLVTVIPSSDYSFSVSAISSELSKVTHCNEKFGSDYGYWADLPTSVKSVALVNCCIDFYDCGFHLDMENRYWKPIVEQDQARLLELERRRPPSKRYTARKSIGGPGPDPYNAVWEWTMSIPHLVMDRSLVPVSEGEDDDNLAVKVALGKALDAQGLIWPYPSEQLQWLLTSLDKLDETVLEVVKDADEKWQAKRKADDWDDHWEQRLEQLKITTVASSDGRRLTSLDLAFFGRLLVSLDKVQKIADLESPPFAFPDESHICLER